jgi:hypothetical protein
MTGAANSLYLVIASTLVRVSCGLIGKSRSTDHLHEIHTKAQPPLVTKILQGDHIIELARLRDFLKLPRLPFRFVSLF